ncbi:MAG TPA: hypothetical protein VJT09_04715 [Pyrinomonadaceae bacterium]|nr:hypothetical protein [Pyrinomonadaceae bacterium]
MSERPRTELYRQERYPREGEPGPEPGDEPEPGNDPFNPGVEPGDDPFNPGVEPGDDPFNPGVEPGPVPGPENNQGFNPQNPIDIQNPPPPPNERVQPGNNPLVAVGLDNLRMQAEQVGDQANNAPTESKLDTFNKYLTVVMGIGALVGIGSNIITFLQYAEARAKGQSGTQPAGLTPEQQAQLDQDITKWINLTDEQTWQKLSLLVKDEQLTYPQQFLLLNFLSRARSSGKSWSWDATSKNDLVQSLAQEFNDYTMYTKVWDYTYQGQHLPFDIGAEIIRLALVQKYLVTGGG